MLKHSLLKVLQDISKERAGIQVDPVKNGLPEWDLRSGSLTNAAADYFRIKLFRDETNRRRLIIHQSEEALVVLLVTEFEGDVFFLLNVRSEPGLIGLTCMTTTIQSTYSNYMQIHGGASTPYIQIPRGEQPSVLAHDSIQFDWGEHYHGKTKRFMVMQVDSDLPVAKGFAWVSIRTAKEMLLKDHLMTADLRSALGVSIPLFEPPNKSSPRVEFQKLRQLSVWESSAPPLKFEDIKQIEVKDEGILKYEDDYGSTVQFFQTIAPSREVKVWVQPLLRTAPKKVTLYRVHDPEQDLFAVRLVTQTGIQPKLVWLPSEPSEPPPGRVRKCETSAEGGRFFQNKIEIQLVSLLQKPTSKEDSWPVGTKWVSREDLRRLVSKNLETSLELRLAWSLVIAK